ncbi:MAG: UDP-N-acetylmuramate dehydrogenase [Candidatus Aegiribacteria sp.]|nr:UDP-N-acetylmuramate dehydrogenase [Candidatus Aegiribacteria sp.]
MNKVAADLLKERYPDAVRSIQLSEWTTWQVGGPAISIVVSSTGMLSDLLGVLRQEGIQWFLIGRGSNILASDDGCSSIIIRLAGDLATVRWEHSGSRWKLSCGGGTRFPSMSGVACSKGASGLTFAIGIPGTVGGAVFMNAGAYGSSIKDILTEVDVVDSDGNERVIRNTECGFSYRSSRFQKEALIVTGAMFLLNKADPAVLRSEAKRILQLRREKFPLEYPNAGSVFRKPFEGPPPGKLIEDSGLKGRTVGGAMVSEKHANFIVNTGHASSYDILELVNVVREEVMKMSGILLKEEIRYLGRRG